MITAKDFRSWQNDLPGKVNGAEVARQIGRSDDTISRWRTAGVPDSEERMVRLAMAALANGLPPWRLA